MASGLQNQEAVARAVLEKDPVSGGTPSPEQAAAKRIQEALHNNGPRAALEKMKENMDNAGKAPVDRVVLQEQRQQAYAGTERDSSGQIKQTAEQQAAQKKHEKADKLTADLIDKGFDGLTNSEKGMVYNRVLASLRLWPEANAVLGGMPATKQLEIVKDLVGRPDFKAKLHDVMTRPMDETGLEAGDEFKKLQGDVTQKDRDMQAAERTYQTKDRDLTATNTQLARFDSSNIGGHDKLDKLIDLEGKAPTLKQEQNEAQALLDQATAKLAQLNESRTNARLIKDATEVGRINTLIDAALADKDKHAKAVAEKKSQLDELEALKAERTKLQADKDRLESETVQAYNDWEDKRNGYFDAKANLDLQKLKKGSAEQQYASQAERSITIAANEYIQEKAEEADDARTKLLEEEKAKATNEGKKKLIEELQKRYKVEGKTGKLDLYGRDTVKLDKYKIEEDYVRLLKDGPDLVFDSIMAGTMTTDELDALKSDKDFMKDARATMVGEVFAKQAKMGRITENEAELLMGTDWGKDALTKAIDSNKLVEGELKKMREAGLIKDTGDLLQKVKDKHLQIGGGLGLVALIILLTSGALLPALGVGAVGLATHAIGKS